MNKWSIKKCLVLVMSAVVTFTSQTLLAQNSLSALEQSVKAPTRSTQNMLRDQYRNPIQTLTFFDIKPTDTVVEISPGSGWYTEILAPLLKDKGTYYAAHFPADSTVNYYKKSLKRYQEKLTQSPLYSKVKVTEFAPFRENKIAPANSADLVLTFRNLHNWYSKGDEGVINAFKDFYSALKPGGILGIVEHRLPEQLDQSDNQESGYLKTSLAISWALQAGFELVGSSEINANAKDTAQHPRGVWTLPPSLRLGEQDKAKYQAIGESDRFTLKFRKPI